MKCPGCSADFPRRKIDEKIPGHHVDQTKTNRKCAWGNDWIPGYAPESVARPHKKANDDDLHDRETPAPRPPDPGLGECFADEAAPGDDQPPTADAALGLGSGADALRDRNPDGA